VQKENPNKSPKILDCVITESQTNSATAQTALPKKTLQFKLQRNVQNKNYRISIGKKRDSLK
jgi:hypothetical protein